MAYDVRIAPAAERAIAKLPAAVKVAVFKELEQLADEPHPSSCEKVRGLGQYDVFRIKVERDYRIIYQVEGDVVVVLRVIHTSRPWPPEQTDTEG